ncbi:putative methionine adenosyltransferase [Medicago truncatula]|uniref:Putative methionine adenosyltransferase n=1 Tax=Medicago truncatula TaxID=3880 RepID=G7LCN3_MEDTR|nr:methionine adenosyltransferase 2 subunit beta [Medicago truncatula]AET02100.1 dTDP-4-dehydrorhamnose dehydrogenase [Medicago truncatula]RHN40000.1 putative methionine adenosyltransferase [Medicago truncatula]
MSKKKILIVGGTGYLGQHLLQSYYSNQSLTVAFTYHSSPLLQPLLDAFPDSQSFQVDLKSGIGFDAISNAFGQPDVVVNCAAISVPRACENDPDTANAINVPSSLVKWLQSFKQNSTLLIHLSTDQVYEGEKSFYKEEDIPIPVNVYGKTKVAAEKFISENFPNFAILRSSIIYGPQTVSPVPKSLPIQWIDSALSKREKVNFFHDEFRCPIFVKDLVTIILALTSQWLSEGKQMQLLLNAGGPDRVSRVEMADAVAQFRGYDTSLIKAVSASTVDRGVKSPADISMDITRLVQTLNINPVSFKDGVKLTLTTEAQQ